MNIRNSISNNRFANNFTRWLRKLCKHHSDKNIYGLFYNNDFSSESNATMTPNQHRNYNKTSSSIKIYFLRMYTYKGCLQSTHFHSFKSFVIVLVSFYYQYCIWRTRAVVEIFSFIIIK